MAGILDKYNSQSWKLAYYPEADGLISRNGRFELNPQFLNSKLDGTFNETNLDLENPNPLGGPINEPYTTKVGSEVISSVTTQPYTPKSTYVDSLQDPLLIARATDPYK